jgi:hypothetical protein
MLSVWFYRLIMRSKAFCSSVVHCLFWHIWTGFHCDHWQFLPWIILFLCIRNRLVGSWDSGRKKWYLVTCNSTCNGLQQMLCKQECAWAMTDVWCMWIHQRNNGTVKRNGTDENIIIAWIISYRSTHQRRDLLWHLELKIENIMVIAAVSTKGYIISPSYERMRFVFFGYHKVV